jgi:hypothetical protein
MLDFIERHRRNLLGSPKDKTGLIDVVDELHGQDTGNATAKALREGGRRHVRALRLRFNRAGGDIGCAPTSAAAPPRPAQGQAGPLEEFRADLLRELAPEKMIDPLTGGAFTPERLDEFIEASLQEHQATNGLSEIGGSGGLASRALANRRSDPRFFVFKDGEAWLRIAAKYGDGNPFEAIMSHVHGMAATSPSWSGLGPNPAASWRARSTAPTASPPTATVTHTGVINGTSAAKYHAERMWRYMNGDLTVPVLARRRRPPAEGSAAGDQRAPRHPRRADLGAARLGADHVDRRHQHQHLRAQDERAAGVERADGLSQAIEPARRRHRRFAVYLAAGRATRRGRWPGCRAGSARRNRPALDAGARRRRAARHRHEQMVRGGRNSFIRTISRRWGASAA